MGVGCQTNQDGKDVVGERPTTATGTVTGTVALPGP
jgi:hypothetical protein